MRTIFNHSSLSNGRAQHVRGKKQNHCRINRVTLKQHYVRVLAACPLIAGNCRYLCYLLVTLFARIVVDSVLSRFAATIRRRAGRVSPIGALIRAQNMLPVIYVVPTTVKIAEQYYNIVL